MVLKAMDTFACLKVGEGGDCNNGASCNNGRLNEVQSLHHRPTPESSVHI